MTWPWMRKIGIVFNIDLCFNKLRSLKIGGETASTGIKKLKLHTEVLRAR